MKFDMRGFLDGGIIFLMALGINALLLLGSSVLIEANLVGIENGSIFVLLSVIISVFCGAFLLVKKSGAPVEGAAFSLIYFGLMCVCAFVCSGTDFICPMLAKLLVAVAVGLLLGCFAGRKAYYKSKMTRRKRKSSVRAL